MRQWITIGIVLVMYLVLATTYSLMTPLGEGPDEPGHAKYVFFLAREARLPVQCVAPCVSDAPGEGHQPPLAYALAAPALLWLPQERRDFDLPGNRKFIWIDGSETNAVAHGSREYWPWDGEVLAWHLARLVNVGLGAITVMLTYIAGRRLFGPAVGILAATMIGLNPQFLFTAGLLTNDTLLAMLAAGLLLLLTQRGKQTVGRAIAIGALLGLALITKQSALVLAPIAGLWCLIEPRTKEQENKRTRRALNNEPGAKNQEPRTQSQENQAARSQESAVRSSGAPSQAGISSVSSLAYLRRIIMRGVGVFGTALLISGWWYLRNWQLYGDPLGLAVFQAEFVTQAFEAGKFAAWQSGLVTLHDSLWARFGWMNVLAPEWVIGCYLIVELLAIAGIVRSILNRRAFHSPSMAWALLIFLPVLALAWVVSFALTAGLVAWQGRLLFPALPAIAILLGYGLVRLIEPRSQESGVRSQESEYSEQAHGQPRTENCPESTQTTNHEPRTTNHRATEPRTSVRATIVSSCAALGFFGLALWLPFGVIKPAYPFQTLPAAEAIGRLGTPVYARFAARADERGAELRGVRVDGNPKPGETLTVTLIWHALGRQNRTWQVFIHLADDQENILAEDNREPRNGQFRMTQWVAGDWVEDAHPLKLPADLAPGTYRLRVGLWYIKTGGRAGRYSAGDELLGDFIDVGSVTIDENR